MTRAGIEPTVRRFFF